MSSTANHPEPIPDHVATADQYRQALLDVRPNLTDNMLSMLRFQYSAPDRTVTATELAQSVGYAAYGAANIQYGRMGSLMAEALGFTPPRRVDGTHRYWTTLSMADPEQEDDEHWRFVMRPELAAAVAELGWADRG